MAAALEEIMQWKQDLMIEYEDLRRLVIKLTMHLMQLENRNARFEVEPEDHRSDEKALDFENLFYKGTPTYRHKN